MKLSDLQVRIFRTPLNREDSVAFEEVYRFWDDVWRAANNEIGRTSSVPSDMVSRQHEIIALYHDGQPIATVCHRFVDFTSSSTFNDSYFVGEIWHEEDKARVRAMGGYGIIGNQITIHPDFRKTTSGLGTKYLITFLSLTRAQEFDVDMIIAMLRSDKGLDRVFYDAGAHPLVKMRTYRNIVVDLVTFHPKTSPIVIHPDYELMVRTLRKNAVVSASVQTMDDATKIAKPSRRTA